MLVTKISVITVNLNNLEGLQRTMTSVFAQTWQEFEYLVIDGGSTDGSKKCIEENATRIDHWISEPDKGIYNAMNKGIRAAKGEYLLFLNSGDEFYSSKVLEENKDFIHTEDLVYFDIFLVFQEGTRIHHYPEDLNFKTFQEGAIGHPTTFIHRSLFQKIGFYDERLRIVADWKFFAIAVVKHNCTRKKVKAVLSKFYMDGVSSLNGKLVEEERKKVLRRNFPVKSAQYALKRKFVRLKENSFLKKLLRKIGII